MTQDRRAARGLQIVEKAIELFAPTWALRRSLARHHIESVRGFDAINDQASRLRRANMTATEDLQVGRTDLLTAARNLDRNNSWASGAFSSITGNVVGRGIRPESNIRKQSGDNRGQPDTAANKKIEALWNSWADGADLTGKQSYAELQRQIYRERWISNDVLVARHIVPDRRIPLALEVVPSERLADEDGANFLNVPAANTVIQGIEFNPGGQIVAYHLYEETPELKLYGQTVNTTRVPQDKILHIFKPHRPGAVRGLSPVSTVAQSFEALARYLNHELTRAGISSAFVFLHKSGGPGIAGLTTGNATDKQDAEGNQVVAVEGGTILKGSANDSIEGVGPAITNTAFDPFVTLILRSIATALGISYELLARDFTKTNFSSARQSSLEDRRQWEPEQDFINSRLNQPVWDWWTSTAIVAGALPRRTLYPVLWMPQGWQWVDPSKEAAATREAIDMGLDSAIKAAARRGSDVFENLEQTAAVEAFKKDLGLTATQDSNETETDDDEDEDEDSKEEGTAGSSQGGRARLAAI